MTAHSTAWAIVGASLIAACAGPVPDASTEDAASELTRKTAGLCDNPYWTCTYQTLCCFPTSGCRATYSTRCARC